MEKSPLERMEEKFKIYSSDWLDAELKIENLTLNGEDIPEELYEQRWVMWENVDFLLEQVVKLGLVDAS